MQVSIRPIQEQDAYTSVNWRNDKDVFKYTGNTYDHVITIESELEWIKDVIKKNELHKDYRCAILADNEYVGNIYLTDIQDGTAEYHIFIGNRDYWGMGVAKQASLLILHYAFKNLLLDSVRLKVRIANETAFHLYKRLGFEEISRNQEWISMAIFRI